MGKEGFYLVTTAHLRDGVWFRDEEDFKVGMNFVAIQACRSPLSVLAFVLMSNHLHFAVMGDSDDVKAFVDALKQRFSTYLSLKYGSVEFLRRNKVHIQVIPSGAGDEGLERAIAYIQMNCVAANICSHPTQYPWGSGSAFFQVSPVPSERLDSLSLRAQRRLLHSWDSSLPGHLRVCIGGYILPESFIAVRFVESLFRTAKRMNYFLSRSSKARWRLEPGGGGVPAFRDQSILSALPDLCGSLFQKRCFSDLAKQEKKEILRHVRYRFSANESQIARVVGMAYEEVVSLLEGV